MRTKKYYFIYKIVNSVNSKVYVGRHFGRLEDNYSGSGMLLHRAYRKYGRDKFTMYLIERNRTDERNKAREKILDKKVEHSTTEWL